MTLTPELAALLDVIIVEDEGGWILTSNADDADGGWTYAGVTSTVFNASGGAAIANVAAMQNAIAANAAGIQQRVLDIYSSMFIIPAQVARVPLALQRPYLSACINLGVAGGVRVLQTALEVTPDGIIGLQTMSALARSAAPTTMLAFRVAWEAHYIAIASASAELWAEGEAPVGAARQWRNLLGWFNRAERACAGANGSAVI